MFEVHILNVALGDSIILHSQHEGKSYYSLIDCKKVADKTPTVEFLKERNITDICSIILTHFHHDHCSGFPELYEYLKQSHGTLNYYISPYLPEEIELRQCIVELSFNKAMIPTVDNIIGAIDGFMKLPSTIHEDGKAKAIRMNYEHNRTPSAWRSDIHPGLSIAPVSPDPKSAYSYIKSALQSPNSHGKLLNATSHTFLIKYQNSQGSHIGLFTGDMEKAGKWSEAKNTCLKITQESIRDNIRILKIAHHGSAQVGMERSLKEMINTKTRFLASISCPPGSRLHPSKKTLNFLKNNFQECIIACTNISAFCKNLVLQDNLEYFGITNDEDTFLDYVNNDKSVKLADDNINECAGDHSLSITDTESDFQYKSSTDRSCFLKM